MIFIKLGNTNRNKII